MSDAGFKLSTDIPKSILSNFKFEICNLRFESQLNRIQNHYLGAFSGVIYEAICV